MARQKRKDVEELLDERIVPFVERLEQIKLIGEVIAHRSSIDNDVAPAQTPDSAFV